MNRIRKTVTDAVIILVARFIAKDEPPMSMSLDGMDYRVVVTDKNYFVLEKISSGEQVVGVYDATSMYTTAIELFMTYLEMEEEI